MPFEHPNNRKERKENERKTDEHSLTTQLIQEQNDFLSLLHNKARNHLLNFRTILEKKKKGEQGKEEWNTLVNLLSRIEKQLENELHIEGKREEASVLANKLVIYFREGADKTEEGTFQEVSYYVQLLRDSINEVGREKFFSAPSLSIKKCIEEHNRKKEVILDAKYETDTGTVVLDNLEYVTKDEQTGEEVVHHCKLIKAEDPGHLKRATKYASVNSHVCVGDDTQSYGKKLNLPASKNGIEIYFLWEDDGSDGVSTIKSLLTTRRIKGLNR